MANFGVGLQQPNTPNRRIFRPKNNKQFQLTNQFLRTWKAQYACSYTILRSTSLHLWWWRRCRQTGLSNWYSFTGLCIVSHLICSNHRIDDDDGDDCHWIWRMLWLYRNTEWWVWAHSLDTKLSRYRLMCMFVCMCASERVLTSLLCRRRHQSNWRWQFAVIWHYNVKFEQDLLCRRHRLSGNGFKMHNGNGTVIHRQRAYIHTRTEHGHCVRHER